MQADERVTDLASWLTAIWDEEERLATDDLTPGPPGFRPEWLVERQGVEG